MKLKTLYKLRYPIVQDNNYATWKAYSNRYWPAKYLINKDGKIVYTHFGEGKYDETEMMIQKLLMESGSAVNTPIDNKDYEVYSRTPELYLGLSRLRNFSSNERPVLGSKNYTATEIEPNTFAFEGVWNLSDEYANPSDGSKLFLNYFAKNVFLVMRTNDGSKGFVDVVLNGQKIETVTVENDKLYNLVEMDEAKNYDMELIFNSGNIEIFAFTFG